MLQAGLPDSDVMCVWLRDMGLERYLPLLSSAGYDMMTVKRMTPEDLTAIGVQDPGHRKRLKAEINRLTISDGIPEGVPVSEVNITLL